MAWCSAARRAIPARFDRLGALACVQRAVRWQSSFSGLTNMIDKDDSLSYVGAHDKYGFTVNGIHMRGSVIVFKNFTLLWNVARPLDICPRNLAVVHMIRPRPGALRGPSPRLTNPSQPRSTGSMPLL